jgi:hypothetical protein
VLGGGCGVGGHGGEPGVRQDASFPGGVFVRVRQQCGELTGRGGLVAGGVGEDAEAGALEGGRFADPSILGDAAGVAGSFEGGLVASTRNNAPLLAMSGARSRVQGRWEGSRCLPVG